MMRQSIWQRLGRAARDPSFLIGALMVAALLIIAFIGPEIAPYNPFLRNTIQWIDGQIVRAPIPPGPTYILGTDAWGRDLLSLLLYGARTTLMIAFIATMVRMLLGLILGALAGWFPESFLDRAVSAVTELLAAIPGIILAMLLVFAIGIRRGQLAFVIAISVVGWGEVTQIMRSHVLSLRKQLFVEAARAVGLSPLEILSRHILPNLLSTMLSLTALQMGSALLLLGELGFLSVFLGGGALIMGDAGTPSALIFETPDWGAMLGSTWRSFRSLPWLPGAPAIAFLISILAFNIFGFGLQRFSERGRFYPSGWSVLRFVGIAAAFLFALQFALSRTGPQAEFRTIAREFNAARAYTDVAFLSDPDLEGRYPGSEGNVLAASYIASQFDQGELTPFPYGSFFQTFSALHGTVTARPMIDVLGPDGTPILTIDEGISYDPEEPFSSTGVIETTLSIYGTTLQYESDRYRGLNFVLPVGREFLPGAIRILPDEAVPTLLEAPLFQGPLAFLAEEPVLILGQSKAAEILQAAGLNLEEIWQRVQQEGELTIDTGLPIRVHFGLEYEMLSSVNVVGYMPGTDPRVQTQRIIIAANYTGSAPVAGEVVPAADDNASGVALMLEVLRLWREQDFLPKHTVIFAAFDEAGGYYYLSHPILPSRPTDSATAVVISGIGAGEERLARLQVGGDYAAIFDSSARMMGVRTKQLDYWPFFFAGTGGRGWDLSPDPSYSGLAVTRLGDELSSTPADTIDHISLNLLEDAGKTLAHFLMVLSSQ
jgi:peptide/nickel transport system permease protein